VIQLLVKQRIVYHISTCKSSKFMLGLGVTTLVKGAGKKRQGITAVGHYVEELCRLKGLTPEECALKSGLKPSVLSRAMRGIVSPEPKTIDKIIQALEITDEQVKDEIYLSFWRVRPEQHERAMDALARRTEELKRQRRE
jgi:transcriptional regulator with XRE-family HTH domain